MHSFRGRDANLATILPRHNCQPRVQTCDMLRPPDLRETSAPSTPTQRGGERQTVIHSGCVLLSCRDDRKDTE